MDKESASGAPRVLMLIASPKWFEKAIVLLENNGVPVRYVCNAQGTASSEILEVLGLGMEEKILIMSIMPKEQADRILFVLKETMWIGTTNSGIAFTISVTSGSRLLVKYITERYNADMKQEAYIPMDDDKYSLIVAICNRGYSEQVMIAARSAGATGGTVTNSRRVADENVMKEWGFAIQAEKETIFIVTPAEKKLGIMSAISGSCGLKSEARSIVFSLPLENAVGLKKLPPEADNSIIE